MSVVTREARRRWSVVVAGAVLLLGLPSLVTAAGARSGDADTSASGSTAGSTAARALLDRALASAAVPHSGLARSTGSLGLPDLPRLGSVAATLGGSTRTRVWWATADAWRVDVLEPTGERGIYGTPDGTVLWDYEEVRLTRVTNTRSTAVRLPRADDLLPPQAARRLLATVGPGDRLQVIPGGRTIAGTRADGLRVVPADARSTIGRLDVWLDPARGLPLAVDVVDRRGVPALQSSFDEVHWGTPTAGQTRVPSAPGARRETTDAPDLLAQVQRFSTGQLPDVPRTLAGLPASSPVVGGTVAFGSGLVRVVVVPLPARLAARLINASTAAGAVRRQSADGVSASLVSGPGSMVTSQRADRQRAFLVTGLVTPELLETATAELLRQPLPEGVG